MVPSAFTVGLTGALVVVGVSDYVIRPRLIGTDSELPPLVTFAALFGGVEVFARGSKPDGTEVVAVNVSCFDAVDLSKIKMTPVDGRSR